MMNEILISTGAATPNLGAVYDWGLSVIRLFQSIQNPVLTTIAKFFTMLGSPALYIALLPITLWCVDEKRGFKIGMTVFLSNGINVALKQNLRVERPFTHDPSVKMIEPEDLYSTPSGHAQNSATFWPMLLGTGSGHAALRVALMVALPLCIGLSRIYLGVHYPTDVFFGWALGAAIAAISIFAVPRIIRAINENRSDAITAFRQSLKTYRESTGRSFRSFKLAIAALAALLLNATSDGDSSMGGLVFGFAAGYIFLTDGTAPRFTAAAGSRTKKVIRFALGLAILGGLYFGLKIVLSTEGSQWYALCRFLRYGIVGFWASWGAPKLFMKLKLV
jgi:membrane-associated phospholipid phosphatase